MNYVGVGVARHEDVWGLAIGDWRLGIRYLELRIYI
jgi:hypothetical protein